MEYRPPGRTGVTLNPADTSYGEQSAAAVFATALVRAGTSLDAARDGEIGGTQLFRLDPNDPVFAASGWPEARIDTALARAKSLYAGPFDLKALRA